MKKVVILLLVITAMAWGQDSSKAQGGLSVLPVIIKVYLDSLIINHNPDYEYIVEIKTDTVWADKIPVYLTPEEYKDLMKLLQQGMSHRYAKSGKPCFITNKEWIRMGRGDLQDLKILEEMERLYNQVKEKLK